MHINDRHSDGDDGEGRGGAFRKREVKEAKSFLVYD
jgi:hypothetical protein